MLRKRRRPPVYAGRGGVRREVKSILFGGARRRHMPRLPAALVAALASGLAMFAIATRVEARPAGEGRVVAVATQYGLPGDPPPAPAPAAPPQAAPAPPAAWPAVRWRRSRAVGLPYRGRLVRGVRLPREGEDFFTWDPILKRKPNRPWRRHGTDRLVRTVLHVLREFRAANPGAPRVGVGDLSRPRGGDFGVRFGGLGHLSHQNGLDVDLYYVRRDGREDYPHKPALVDRRLAQDLVDRFVAAGAEKVFVGPRLALRGPRRVVVPLAHHDDHLHVRLPAR